MTHGGSGGLVVDAEVRRGSFTLEVSLAAAPGQVLGLLGPNGAGKSTLLSAVAGLTPVSAGRITLGSAVFDDADQGTFVEASGRPIGFVFQNYRLFPHMSVAENVAFSPRARGQGKQAARSAASYWLDRLRLTDLADRKPGQLSGGQAQRVALARALAGQPSLLLLDEPLSALDAGTRLDVQAELKRHLSDFAGPSLLVTHDPLEALVLADQMVVLEGGRIVQEGTPALIARQPGTDYVAKLVGLNLYAGRADGSAVALNAGGTFVIPDHGQHGDVLVAVRPSAIVVSTQPPQSTSARNTWQAKITGLTLLADQVVVLEDGRIVQEGTPAQIARQPGTDYVAKLVGLNLYAGRADGDTVALAEGGTFVIPDHGQHGDVHVAVRPSAIVVSTQPLEHSSARNTWQAKISGLTLLADRVRLDLDGQPPALVDVTPAAVAELSLDPGSQVWLTVKATDLEVYPRNGAQAD